MVIRICCVTWFLNPPPKVFLCPTLLESGAYINGRLTGRKCLAYSDLAFTFLFFSSLIPHVPLSFLSLQAGNHLNVLTLVGSQTPLI